MCDTQKLIIKTKSLIIMMSYLMCSPWFCCVFSVLMIFFYSRLVKNQLLFTDCPLILKKDFYTDLWR